MLASFDTGGHTYRISKLNAFDQFNIARRLSQALVPLGNLRQAADERPDDKALALAFVTLAANLAEDDVTKSMATLLAGRLGSGRGCHETKKQGNTHYSLGFHRNAPSKLDWAHRVPGGPDCPLEPNLREAGPKDAARICPLPENGVG